jgi:hypothetical protein
MTRPQYCKHFAIFIFKCLYVLIINYNYYTVCPRIKLQKGMIDKKCLNLNVIFGLKLIFVETVFCLFTNQFSDDHMRNCCFWIFFVTFIDHLTIGKIVSPITLN